MGKTFLCGAALVAAMLAAFPGRAVATTYEVGPGKPYANVGDVPWESLNAGDTVLIYYRATPYKEKFVLAARRHARRARSRCAACSARTASGPILDGNGATTRAQLNYPSRVRGVIKIGGVRGALRRRHDGDAAVDRDREPGDPRRAATPTRSPARRGATETYTDPASAIYVEFGENITVRNCDLHDNGNGFFAFSIRHHRQPQHPGRGQLHPRQRQRRQHLRAQRLRGGDRHHVPVQPLRRRCLPGAGGNNLKDRSAGLVVRYNWIEGSNRQLDLVDAEDSALVRADPRYRATHVYGNVIIEHPEQRQQRHRLLRRRRRLGAEVPQGDALLLQQHRRLRPHRHHAAVPPGHQRREPRRPQQHRLRDRGRQQPAGARQLRPADADPELVQDRLDAVRREPSQGDASPTTAPSPARHPAS